MRLSLLAELDVLAHNRVVLLDCDAIGVVALVLTGDIGVTGASRRLQLDDRAYIVTCHGLDLLSACADLGDDGLDAVAVDDLKTLGGHIKRDVAILRGQVEPAALDVRIPTTVRAPVGVRDGLAEARLASRYLANCRHGYSFSYKPTFCWGPNQ